MPPHRRSAPGALFAALLLAFGACKTVEWPAVPDGDRDRGQLVGFTEGSQLKILMGFQDEVRERIDPGEREVQVRDHLAWDEDGARFPQPGDARVFYKSRCAEADAPCTGDYVRHEADERFSFPYESREEYVGPTPYKACLRAEGQTYCRETFEQICATRYYATDAVGTRHRIGEDLRWGWRCAD